MRQRLLRKCKEEEGPGFVCESSPSICFIAVGVRVTLHLGPQLLCGVCDISPCDDNGWGSHTGGTSSFANPYQLPERIEALVPLGWGQAVGPELDPKQQCPSQTEPTVQCTFQAQAMTFLSPKLQKRKGI